MINGRINKLRAKMKEMGIDAYVIPSSDSHQSEYVADYFKSRAWMSGFTGSAGIFVVTQKESALFTDGRYHIQAAEQIKDTEIVLYKSGLDGVISYDEYISNIEKERIVIGFDGRTISLDEAKKIKLSIEKKLKMPIFKMDEDLVDEIWEDRPSLPTDKIFIHEIKYAGMSIENKLSMVRDRMNNMKADAFLLSSLADIAWLFNLRGSDVKCNPVFLSYALIFKDKVILFVNKEKLNLDIIDSLRGVEIKEYDDIYETINKLNYKLTIMYDRTKTSVLLHEMLPSKMKRIYKRNITENLKAIKNTVEIENLEVCQIRDGVSMVEFLYWIANVEKTNVTEIDIDKKLIELRKKGENYVGTSFDTIAAYKDHGAMMHYFATKESNYSLGNESFLLVDSGGQYLDGTTDITRTIALGEISEKMKEDFTLVLKGHIALARAKFLYGACGMNLDTLARLPLWEKGIDYKCGTGHGVGFFMNVHEGPQGIRMKDNNIVLEDGMLITNEPGIYRENEYGIRTENTLLVRKGEETPFGQFMYMETISYCPIDLTAIDVCMLNEDEKKWLNDYHSNVYKKLSPHLDDEHCEFLKMITKNI